MHKGIIWLAAALTLAACKDDTASQLTAIEQKRDARTEQIALISDAAARDTLGFLTSILYRIERSFIEIRSPYDGPVSYTQPALQRLNDYDNVSTMTDTFIGSLWAARSFISAVDIEQPFDYPLPHTLTWDTIMLEDGTAIPISTDYDPEMTEIQAIDTRHDFRVIYDQSGGTPEGASPVSTISGTFTTTLPTNALTARFEAGDAGDTQTIGDFEVKLIEVENHLAIVDIRRTDGEQPTFDSDAVFVEATDTTGAYLDSFANNWGDPEQFAAANAAFDDLIQAVIDGDIEDLSEDALDAEMIARTGIDNLNGLYGHIGFRGIIDTVEIILLPPGETKSHSITLPTREFSGLIDGPDIPDIATRGSVYDHETASFLATAPIDIDPAEINTAITAEQDSFRDLIRFEYPDVISNLFLDVFDRYEDDDQVVVNFLDSSGNTIPVAEDAFEFTINRVEFDPAMFPTPPARVTGQFPVYVMTDMPREVYDATTNPEAVRIVDNQVRIERNQFRNWDANNYIVLARNPMGQLLKKITTQGVRSTDDERIEVHYFYGDVAEVELLKAGAIETVIHTFDAAITASE